VEEDVAQDLAFMAVPARRVVAATMLGVPATLWLIRYSLVSWAVIFCRLPNSTFEAASVPVGAVPSQPSSVPKKG
jgi:hypothetical protein